ncbi:homoserine dehydrogenase [Deltaproteobacteria bacterium TL4]
MTQAKFQIAIVGLGTIGSGVAKITQCHDQQASPIHLRAILEKNLQGPYAQPIYERNPELFVQSLEELIHDPELDLIVETVGGRGFAKEVITQALTHGKHVVTANKDLMATHGHDLTQLAIQNKRHLLFEASVGGAIPVLRLLQNYFYAPDIKNLLGIVNGTTNYILSAMERRGISYAKALGEAQEKGFAEQDPSNDVKGYDARYKLVILNYLITRQWLEVESLHVEGIDHLDLPDFEYAERMGKKIKLIAYASWNDGRVNAFVLPLMLPAEHTLSKIQGSTNIITIQERYAQEISLIGPGAGSLPTASAILADIYKIRQTPVPSDEKTPVKSALSPFSEYRFKHTLRFQVRDSPGIVGNIGNILAKYKINIYALEQLPQYHNIASNGESTVIFTLTLEACQELLIQQATQEINKAPYIVRPIGILRELAEN